jgi:glycosyltransferase involved in cell wall biosynthesis
MQLTVALCTYNPSRELLLRALDAIIGQLGTVEDAEIVVIDNNSAPSLAKRGYLCGYPVRLIEEPRQGLTAARETAVRQAQGDIIVFVDDDNILGEGYLQTVVNTFAGDTRLGLLGGSVVAEYEQPPPRWFHEFEPQLAIRRYAPGACVETTDIPYSDHFPVGAGFVVRRELALAYVRDCEETKRIEGRQGAILSSGEDTDLGLFALQTGHKLAVTGNLCVTHVIPARRLNSDYVARLMVGTVRSTMELEQKWRERYGRPVFPFLSAPMAGVLAKTAAAFVLSPWSTRYRIKYRVLRTLARIRLEARFRFSRPPGGLRLHG